MILKETPRLILRHFEMTDEEALFKLDSDPEVLRYLHTPLMESIEGTREIISRIQREYESDGTARLIVADKNTREVMGWAGLKFIRNQINGHTNFHDVGYRLLQKFWGKGYATEAAIASLEYGFEDLGLIEIYGMADVENIASNKILTKIGMERMNRFDYEGVPHYSYRIRKEE